MPAPAETLQVKVICTELPGKRFEDPTSDRPVKEPVCLGVHRGDEMIDTVQADAKKAEFSIEFRVGEQKNGKPNFLGPYAHGTADDRFFYLVWAVKERKTLATFRRLKVRLGHLPWPAIRKAIKTAKPITVTLRLTDKLGGPICATPPPDHVRWDID